VFGSVRLADLDRIDLQRFVDKLLADGLAPPTIDVTILPLRAIYRQALDRGDVMMNPCDGLRLPRSNRRRDRIADPGEAEALIAAVRQNDQPLWATAMYAGLRRGELQALRVCDLDLATGVLRVEYGWDFKEGPIELKSNAGRRRVPIAGVLRDHLADQMLRVKRRGTELLFGEDGDRPFRPESIQQSADAAWKEAGLRRITPHECRHTFAARPDDRRRRERKGPTDLHGPREHQDHPGPLRPPDARLRGGGGRPARRLSRGSA
jgi:integrase